MLYRERKNISLLGEFSSRGIKFENSLNTVWIFCPLQAIVYTQAYTHTHTHTHTHPSTYGNVSREPISCLVFVSNWSVLNMF
jgi:hypothetical protein